MHPAHKLDVCTCGINTETYCMGCGTPVCRQCSHMEITTHDPKNIIVAYYCPACAQDPKKNTWGTLYWQNLTALFS